MRARLFEGHRVAAGDLEGTSESSPWGKADMVNDSVKFSGVRSADVWAHVESVFRCRPLAAIVLPSFLAKSAALAPQVAKEKGVSSSSSSYPTSFRLSVDGASATVAVRLTVLERARARAGEDRLRPAARAAAVHEEGEGEIAGAEVVAVVHDLDLAVGDRDVSLQGLEGPGPVATSPSLVL